MILGPEHEETAELLGAYVLDAVDDEEARRIELHLAGCPRCQAETDQLRQVAAALGTQAGLEVAEPPPTVWARIADRIGAGTPMPALEASDGIEAPGSGVVGVPRGTVDATRLARREGGASPAPVRRRRWAGVISAAAAAVVIAALAIGLVSAEGRVSQLQSTVAERGSAAAVRGALASPGHRVVRLRTGTGAPVARLVLERSGIGYVVSSSMSSLPASETYQLWASIDGRAISLGLLGPRPSSGAAFSLGTSVTRARELLVTVEPAGGVVSPDRTPVATAVLGVA